MAQIGGVRLNKISSAGLHPYSDQELLS